MNLAPITVHPGAVRAPDECFADLLALDWVRPGATRSEYFASDIGSPYTYGAGAFARTYHPQPWTPRLRALQAAAYALGGAAFELVFLNHYLGGRDHLGWHADDSPEMDDERPIVIMSLGAERPIWFRPKGDKDAPVEAVLMRHGDVIVMKPGMQETHEHRIPKSSVHNCGPRISLTWRGQAK